MRVVTIDIDEIANSARPGCQSGVSKIVGLDRIGNGVNVDIQDRWPYHLTTLPSPQVLADHGANFVRLRLWLAPPGGYSNLITRSASRPRR